MYLSSKYPFKAIHNHWNLLTFTVFHHIDTICHAFKIQTIFIYKTIEIGSFEYIDANKRHRNQINRKSNKCQTKVDQSFSFYLVHLNSFCNHNSAKNSIKNGFSIAIAKPTISLGCFSTVCIHLFISFVVLFWNESFESNVIKVLCSCNWKISQFELKFLVLYDSLRVSN